MSEDRRAKRHQQLIRSATEAMSKHQIRERNFRRWTMFRRENSQWRHMYWCEIVVMRNGNVIVDGDIRLAAFGYYTDDANDHAAISWMGQHEYPDSYVTGKYKIGMGIPDHCYECDDEVMLDDLDAEIALLEKGYLDEPSYVAKQSYSLNKAKELVRHESAKAAFEYLIDAGYFDGGDIVHLGQVVKADVYYAHAAIRRLYHLLLEERQNQPKEG